MNAAEPVDIATRVAAFASGAVSAREVTLAALEAISKADTTLHAFTAVSADHALAQADALDARRRRGEPHGPLAAVTVAAKDLIDVAGLPTSWGAEAIPDRTPRVDAPVVARLRRAGALVIGKTRTAELAWRTTTPPTANPADSRLIAGGSSGGSAAAVGGSLALGAIGTDTAGSIRLPAALCGIVGIKPTYGAVGRSRVLPASVSLDVVGPMAATVADGRDLLAAMVGPDPADPACAPPSRLRALGQRLGAPTQLELAGARLALIDDPLFEVVEPRAQRGWQAAITQLEQSGAHVACVRIPECRYIAGALLAIDLPESAAVHSNRLREGIAVSPDIASILRMAHAVPAVLTARAHSLRRVITSRVAAVFRQHRLDALITPATVAGAFAADAVDVTFRREDASLEGVLWAYPRPFWLANLTGQPAVVVPTVRNAPPLAIQLCGLPFADDALLDLSSAVERALSGLSDRDTSA